MTNKEREVQSMLITLMLIHLGWYSKDGVTEEGKRVIREYRKDND